VSERTREIGLRKAVGAARRAILSQFLMEAAVLSTLGGLIGIALGMMVSFYVEVRRLGRRCDAPIGRPRLRFSASVGSSGFWPPAKPLLSPIEALRYE